MRRGTKYAMESIDRLLKRVAKVGIKPAYLQRVLPRWVTQYPPESATAITELKVHLARELGLDLNSLQESKEVAFGALPSAPKYKRARGGPVERLMPAASLSYSLGRALAAAAQQRPYTRLPANPAVARAEILSQASAVTLPALVTYLWQHGIPVAHYTDWPDKLSRPSALALDVEGRPVIVVGSPRTENAWHAFYIAHEAGHIARSHLGRNELIVDADLEPSSEERDQQELEADQYALSLLAAPEIDLPQASARFGSLEQSAREIAARQRVDRGHLLLRYAMATGRWDIGSAALQRVEAGANAPRFINRDRAQQELSLDQLSDDRQEFVRRVLALN